VLAEKENGFSHLAYKQKFPYPMQLGNRRHKRQKLLGNLPNVVPYRTDARAPKHDGGLKVSR